MAWRYVRRNARDESIKGSFFGPVPYHAFLAIAGDPFSITHSEEYEQAIRKYFDHPKEQVRWWAEHALGVEGPTSLKRKAEYAEKREAQ